MSGDIEKLRELEAKATLGPWAVDYLDKAGQRVVRADHYEIFTAWHHALGSIEQEMEANVALIVAMRNALPGLLELLSANAAEIERLRGERVWRCFHCDEVFTTTEAAKEHFGPDELQPPGCCIDAAEYRRMELNHNRHLIEDDECSRTFYRMQADHATALIREEEKGYEKGLRDAGSAVVARAEAAESLVTTLRERMGEAWEALDDLLDYSGGAPNALEDEYVVERARATLASLKENEDHE